MEHIGALQFVPYNSISFQLIFSLVLNSDYRSPGHVSVSCFDRLETGDVMFSVSQLILLLSSASAFKNELLSISPFRKKKWLGVN